jgi:hypothetical protein
MPENKRKNTKVHAINTKFFSSKSYEQFKIFNHIILFVFIRILFQKALKINFFRFFSPRLISKGWKSTVVTPQKANTNLLDELLNFTTKNMKLPSESLKDKKRTYFTTFPKHLVGHSPVRLLRSGVNKCILCGSLSGFLCLFWKKLIDNITNQFKIAYA